MFSKDQVYDQSKVQVWPLLRRTHQDVLLRYDHAWSLENSLNSGVVVTVPVKYVLSNHYRDLIMKT